MEFSNVIKVQKTGKLRGCYLLLKGDEVVYVGQSGHIPSRIATHLAGDKDFDGYCYALTDGNLNDIEAELIVMYNPMYNKALPINSIYESGEVFMKKNKIGAWDFKKAMKRLSVVPVWKKCYSVQDMQRMK